MSYKAMDWAFEQECRDSLGKLVLITIAKHADNNFKSFPSVSRIAKLASMSKRSVHRKLLELQDDGLISIKNRGKDGKKTSNLYSLIVVTDRQGVVTDRHSDSDCEAHRLYQSNKSNNNSSITVTDSHIKENIDWTAMGAAALGVAKSEKGKGNEPK